jgi:hypothetical protein
MRTKRAISSFGFAILFAAAPAGAELPDTATLLVDLGLSTQEIADINSGKLVEHGVKSASERELTAGLAFHVPMSPAKLVESSRGLLDKVDPDMIAHGVFSTPAVAGDLAKLTFGEKADSRAKAYVSAKAGGDLNLSTDEIAAFHALGNGAAAADVEAKVRAALLARVQAYQTKGLDGVAGYDLGDGKTRSPADELRTAINASAALKKYAPAAYQYLLSYPNGKPAGTQEAFHWSYFEAHGEPTIALTHALLIPDGDAWILSRRQFYVSTGYNAMNAVAAFLPEKDGTVIVYASRTSTDQITGFGGGAKRSIGSKIMASQLESMFERARKAVQ